MPLNDSLRNIGSLSYIYRRRILLNNSIVHHPSSKHERPRFVGYIGSRRVLCKKPEEAKTIERVDQQPPPPPPQQPPLHSKLTLPSWTKWLFGSLLSLVLSVYKRKWDNLLLIEGKAEKFVEEVETVAEVVEKVATSVEKLAADAEDNLPNGTKLREIAVIVEHSSTVTARDAQLTCDFLHKVSDLEEDLKKLKQIVTKVEPAGN